METMEEDIKMVGKIIRAEYEFRNCFTTPKSEGRNFHCPQAVNLANKIVYPKSINRSADPERAKKMLENDLKKLTEKELMLLKFVYREDFELFGYDPDVL